MRTFNYIAGYDDGSTFVERISPKLKTVGDALNWLKPAEVVKAEKEGRMVRRQGDVFLVELKSNRKNITDYFIPKHHKAVVNGDKVYLTHNEHSMVVLPHTHFKPMPRKTIEGLIYD